MGDSWIILNIGYILAALLCRQESTVRSKTDLSFPGSLAEPSNPRYLMFGYVWLQTPVPSEPEDGALVSTGVCIPKGSHWKVAESPCHHMGGSRKLLNASQHFKRLKGVCSLFHFPKTCNTSLDIFGMFCTECVSRSVCQVLLSMYWSGKRLPWLAASMRPGRHSSVLAEQSHPDKKESQKAEPSQSFQSLKECI